MREIKIRKTHPWVSARFRNPSRVSLRRPDASLCCPGVSWGLLAALQVVTEENPEVIHKQRNASLKSLCHSYYPESYPRCAHKSLIFLTFPLPKPHDPQQILGSFHIWNRGLYPWGIHESVSGPLEMVESEPRFCDLGEKII